MAGNFTQFSAQERQLRDIAPPEAPVADTSGVHEIGAITGAIQAVGSVFEAGANIAAGVQRANQAEALAVNKSNFEQELLKAKDLADQEGSQSLKFNTFLTKAFDESPLDFDVKSKMMKDFQATVLGKSFTELTPEEEVRQANLEAAGKAGYWNSNSSDEEIALGTAEYEKSQTMLRAQQAELAQLNLQKARREATTAERQEVERLILKKQIDAMANLAANHRTPVKNEVAAIVQSFQNGEMSSKDAQQALTIAKGDLNATIAQITRGLDRSQVDPLAKPLLDLYDVAINNLDSSTLLTDLQNQIKLTDAQATRNLQISDPQLVELSALSSMVNHTSPALQATFGEEAARVLKRNSQQGKPADPTGDDDGTNSYLEVVKESAGKLDQLDATNQPIINIEEFVTNVDNILGGSARYIDPDDSPVDNQKILKWLADPQIGMAIKDNLESFSDVSRGKLSDVLVKSAVNHIYPRTTSIIQGDLKPQEEDQLEVTGQGNKVVFRSTSPEPWVQSVAAKLNREVAGALSTYYNAIGNVTGEGFSTVFEREKGILWPSKYGNQESPSQEPVERRDYSQFEDGEYQDEEGNLFTIRNGILIEGRSPANE